MRHLGVNKMLLSCMVIGTAALCVPVQGSAKKNPKYLIAHMTNSVKTVNWAMGEGANALEADLSFSTSGMPNRFYHGAPCDCTMSGVFRKSNHVCKQMSCNTSASSKTVLRTMAKHKKRLALVIIDSKVEAKWGKARLKTAGRQVVALVDRELFARGYRGMVIIGAPYINTYAYLNAAARRAKQSKYKGRYFFTIDGESKAFEKVVKTLRRLPTKNIVYGTGITSLAAATYYDQMDWAAYTRDRGGLGLTYIWTIDSRKSMVKYLRHGVDGIMTNRPSTLKKVIGRLAKPGTPIPSATSSALGHGCDCNYSKKGGCRISKAPPPGLACKCKYKGGWTCAGALTKCKKKNARHCRSPDKSRATCLQGSGDCGGYKKPSCDCNYARGGCRIVRPAPPGYACRCKYKGAWTCGGRVTRCKQKGAKVCKKPDRSKAACRQGQGDCGAYK